MPEEVKPNPNPAQSDDAKRDAAIAESIARGLKPVLESFSQTVAAAQKPAEVRPAPTAQLSRPSEEEVAEAMVNGDKAKVAELLRKQRAYDRQEMSGEINRLSTTGGAAISSVAKTAASQLPYYKRFKKEIDGMVEQFLGANQGAIATFEVYERAHDIIKGQHIDELLAETREEAIRKAREPEEPLQPINDRGEPIEREPQSLAEVLVGDWKKELREKNGRTRNRTDEEELRSMGYRNGFKEFLDTRKQMEEIDIETGGSFGLDRDWDRENKKWVERDRDGRIIN